MTFNLQTFTRTLLLVISTIAIILHILTTDWLKFQIIQLKIITE